MDFFTSVKQTAYSLIKQELPALEQPTIVLGLSGGPDSLFLLHVLHALEQDNAIKLIAAHLDHQWRPESVQDLLFCQDTCAKLGIRFYAGKAKDEDSNIKKNGSQEELGRNLRRAFLRNVMQDNQGHFIALAHHLQDQQETFFIRLLRGSSLDGMTGIKPIENPYIRPLLSYCKEDILAYLHSKKITYLTDPTNTSPLYLRNRIRTTLIPALTMIDQRFNAKFSTTLHNLTEENKFLELLAEQAFASCFSETLTGTKETFTALHPVLQRRVVLVWLIKSGVRFSPSMGFIEEILRFINSPRGGTHHISPRHTILKKKNNFWISPIDQC